MKAHQLEDLDQEYGPSKVKFSCIIRDRDRIATIIAKEVEISQPVV